MLVDIGNIFGNVPDVFVNQNVAKACGRFGWRLMPPGKGRRKRNRCGVIGVVIQKKNVRDIVQIAML